MGVADVIVNRYSFNKHLSQQDACLCLCTTNATTHWSTSYPVGPWSPFVPPSLGVTAISLKSFSVFHTFPPHTSPHPSIDSLPFLHAHFQQLARGCSGQTQQKTKWAVANARRGRWQRTHEPETYLFPTTLSPGPPHHALGCSL